MIRSRGEVEALALKAARGAAVPLGQAEDFAQAVGVLAASGADLACVGAALAGDHSMATTLTGGTLRITQGSVIMAAPMAIDLLLADATAVTVADVRTPALWSAYLAVVARDRQVFLAMSGGCIAPCAPFAPPATGPIHVSDADWDIWCSFAARTFVPATAESRLAGAGAGLTDND